MKKLHPLKVYRKRHNISAAKMGALVGMSRMSIERIERYDQLPPMSTISKFMSVTGLPPTAFFPPKKKTAS